MSWPENDPVDRFPGDWMHCVKLLGQRRMARDFDRQVAELQVRVAVLNRVTALGIPVTQAMGVSPSGERGNPSPR